jgi:hypothetical protein
LPGALDQVVMLQQIAAGRAAFPDRLDETFIEFQHPVNREGFSVRRVTVRAHT